MDDRRERTVLVVIKIPEAGGRTRLVNDFPMIKETLDNFADSEAQLAFRSNDFFLSAYFINTNLPLAIIRAALDKCEGTLGEDSYMAIELGDDFCGKGFTGAGTWLQHHLIR